VRPRGQHGQDQMADISTGSHAARHRLDEPRKPAATQTLLPHATRLFPKNRGADGYAVTGVAARCDWVLLSDHHAPQIHLHRNRATAHPRHIFLSLRAPFQAIRAFHDRILPGLSRDFVLITGSEDITLPRQTDARWRRFTDEEHAMMDAILAHPNLLHWYAENLDQGGHDKRSPLPLGLVFPGGMPDRLIQPAPPPLAQRPLHAFCAHRHREGPQWEARRRVSQLANGPWRAFCTQPASELSEPAFMEQVERHAFVLCVEGGGLDPSPKAFSALLHGAIPIIRDTALTPAYARFPVVVVKDWSAQALSPRLLRRWHNALLPWFDEPSMRREVLHRLSLDYWWRLIESGARLKRTGGMAIGPAGQGE